MHLKIFSYLDHVSSTCLGLTCRNLYIIHKAVNGIVPPVACHLLPPDGQRQRRLYSFLKAWISGTGLIWGKTDLKFVTLERMAEINVAYQVWRMEGRPSSPLRNKLEKAQRIRRLERLRDEKAAGGWWENGTWVDGVDSEEGKRRWEELGWEGDEDAVRVIAQPTEGMIYFGKGAFHT